MNIDIIENHGYDTKREREEDLIRKEDDCTDMLSLQLSVFKSYQTLFLFQQFAFRTTLQLVGSPTSYSRVM